MADSPNTGAPQTNIDDLVKELSRPQGTPPASTPAPGTGSVPSTPPRPVLPPSVPVMPPRPMTPPPTMPNTSPMTPPTPAEAASPAPAGPPATPAAPKEYQSSIRTMTDDIAKLKAGQVPQGVNIPRKVEPVAPAPAPVKPAPAPAPATSAKPAPSVIMPSPTKSASLSASSAPSPAPSSSIPHPTPPASVMAPAAKAPELKPDQKSQFYVPPAASATGGSRGGRSRNLLFIGIAFIAVVLGALYWYFMIYNSTSTQVLDTAVETFTPRPTATPNLDPLSMVFPNRDGAIVLPQSGDPTSAFSAALAAQAGVTPGGFIAVDVVGTGTASASPQVLNLTGLLDRFVAAYPPELKTALNKNFKTLIYGQKEAFDAKGHPVANPPASRRLVIVNEIDSSVAPVLQAWEGNMSVNLAGIMAVTPTKSAAPFATTNYHSASIRFRNFLYPDHSIDYVFLQYNGKTYLVIAGSREAAFAAVNAFTSTVPGK